MDLEAWFQRNLAWAARSHAQNRSAQDFYESESDRYLAIVALRLGIATVVGFGMPVFAKELPGYWKPALNLFGSSTAAGFALVARRPIRRIRRNESAIVGLQSAEVNIAEHQMRHIGEHAPTVFDDSLTLQLPSHAEPPKFRNLAKDMATYDGHMALVSKTRSGKTTLLIGTIQEAQQAGHQVILVDGKGDDRLKAIPGITYIQVNDPNKPDRTARMFEELDRVLKVLSDRQDGATGQPISLFCDEFNLVRDTCNDSPKIDGVAGKDLAVNFVKGCKRILLQGAAAKIYLRLSSHTSRVEDLGLNSGVLDSLSFAALGRNGAYESIEDLIRYQVTGKKAEALQELLDGYRAMELDSPLVLTTLPPMGFCRLPRVEQPIALPPVQVDKMIGEIMIDDEREDDPIERLERLFQITADRPANDESEEQETKGELSDRQRKILEKFGHQNRWIAPSDVQRANLFKEQVSANEIAKDFRFLVSAGYGSCRLTSRTLKWNPIERDE